MKKLQTLLLVPLVLVALTVGWAVSNAGKASADHDYDSNSIVGVWAVDAAAPFRPHLFTFHKDGTMTSTNPTNVQESAGASHGGTNDSLGMGAWKLQKEQGAKYFVGTFWELNAFADNHQPTDTLKVSFKVHLTNDGQGFDGPAVVHLGSDTFPSHVTGTLRVLVDQNAVDSL